MKVVSIIGKEEKFYELSEKIISEVKWKKHHLSMT
jgi:hypothetical protein